MGSYLEEKGADPEGTLAGVHAVLTMDQLANAMALNDKMVIRYFNKEKLFPMKYKALLAWIFR